jgi:hypothetical protein
MPSVPSNYQEIKKDQIDPYFDWDLFNREQLPNKL